jgi:tetratricopeptide (TPR) repeat protein
MARPLLLPAVTRRARTNRKALDAARRAQALAPDFGYAAVRVAELEFSQGRIEPALRELARNPRNSARNAQAHALRGFLLSAQNRIDAARAEFQTAIDLDGALGNGWLGRGLCAIRQGRDDAGRLDLQIAATVEPNRAILYSYLGKAFSEIGDNKSANKDLARAKELDLNDPTPGFTPRSSANRKTATTKRSTISKNPSS